MGKYQDLQPINSKIGELWNKFSAAVLNSDPSLPEYSDSYIDSLGAMKACFKTGSIDAMTLRFLAGSLMNNVQTDEFMIMTPWAGEIVRLCGSVLKQIPQGILRPEDFMDDQLNSDGAQDLADELREPAAAPGLAPQAVDEFTASLAPRRAPTPPAPSVPLLQPESLGTRGSTDAPVPPQSLAPVKPLPAATPVSEDLASQLSSAAARAFGLSAGKSAGQQLVAQARITASEFGEDMPLPSRPLPQVELAASLPRPGLASSATVAAAELLEQPAQIVAQYAVEALSPSLAQIDDQSRLSSPVLAAPAYVAAEIDPASQVLSGETIPPLDDTSLPAVPSVKEENIPQQGEDLDVRAIEDELQTVFQFPQADQLETDEELIADSSSNPASTEDVSVSEPTTQTATEPVTIQPAMAASVVTTGSEASNLAEQAQPDSLSAAQEQASIRVQASLFADPAVFSRASEIYQTVRESVSGFVPKGSGFEDLASLPDDLKPENPEMASIFLNSGPVAIVSRIPGVSLYQEVTDFKRRLAGYFDASLYKSRPFLDYWVLTNFCFERMSAECFSPDGEVLDTLEAASYVTTLGRIALYSDYFMATPFGVDLFETAMRMAHALDPVKASVSAESWRSAGTIRTQIDKTIELIAKTSANPNTMPPIYPYVVDWLAKMMIAITPETTTTDFDLLRDLSVGLSMVIIRCYGLGVREIDDQVSAVCNLLNHLVTKSFWC
jgi:hypothetical protein